jgi:hypothetical protein
MGGPIILLKYVTQMDILDETNPSIIDKCQDKAFNQLLVYAYLENSDETKYGSLLTGLQTQQSLKNNQYLSTLTEATGVSSSYFHNSFNNNNKGQKNNNYNNYKEKVVSSKEKKEQPEMSFANIEDKCYCCGKPGLRSPACCHHNKISKKQW